MITPTHVTPERRLAMPETIIMNPDKEATAMDFDIIDYDPQYREAFSRLNLEWIETYFHPEDTDRQPLSDPETHFIDTGGAIFFAICCGEAVGTIALLKHPGRGFELSKMGVHKPYRGMGIGKQLVLSALARLQAMGEPRVFLETNRKLLTAMMLYKGLGFVQMPFPSGRSERYQRADVYMELTF